MACEHAELTCTQAEAARLCAQGLTYSQIAAHLSLRYRAALRTARAASRRLRACHGHLLRFYYRESLPEVLACLRNARDCRPPGVAVYGERPGGGYDSQPVSFRSVPLGGRAEDHRLSSDQFLRVLPRLLREYERAAAG
jgi:hypothetical protein